MLEKSPLRGYKNAIWEDISTFERYGVPEIVIMITFWLTLPELRPSSWVIMKITLSWITRVHIERMNDDEDAPLWDYESVMCLLK